METSDGESEGERYCICRSTDGRGFMIGCDRCDEWFHGRCIGLTKSQSSNIDKWYCSACLQIDGNLSVVYKQTLNVEKIIKEPPPERHSFVSKAPTFVDPPRKPRKKGGNKDKKQCENPSCVLEARKESKYCSDDCGLDLAKKRLIKHFIPKWQDIKKNATEIEKRFKKELQDLEVSRKYHTDRVDDLIDRLLRLDNDIRFIKDTVHVTKYSEKDEKMLHEDNDEEDNEESEEVTYSELTKIHCVSCGSTIPSDNAFKHWASCFKRFESHFTVSSGCKCHFGTEENPHPPIFCEKEDTKKKQFCKRFLGICVEHQEDNAGSKKDKDEICGCPLKIQQELELDGNYCQEKKSECTTHYNWDKFMKAQLNLQRLHHYFKLDEINEKMRVFTSNLENHYGGIIGLMLHTTKDEHSQSTAQTSESLEEIDCTN